MPLGHLVGDNRSGQLKSGAGRQVNGGLPLAPELTGKRPRGANVTGGQSLGLSAIGVRGQKLMRERQYVFGRGIFFLVYPIRNSVFPSHCFSPPAKSEQPAVLPAPSIGPRKFSEPMSQG